MNATTATAPTPITSNIRHCAHCGLPYDWRRSTSSSLKMTYCGTLCEKGDLGFTLEAFPSMVVGEVDKGGPAERAGLKPGDAVLRHGTRELLAPDELRGLLLLRRPGEELKLVVRRAGAEVEVALSLLAPKSEE